MKDPRMLKSGVKTVYTTHRNPAYWNQPCADKNAHPPFPGRLIESDFCTGIKNGRTKIEIRDGSRSAQHPVNITKICRQCRRNLAHSSLSCTGVLTKCTKPPTSKRPQQARCTRQLRFLGEAQNKRHKTPIPGSFKGSGSNRTRRARAASDRGLHSADP